MRITNFMFLALASMMSSTTTSAFTPAGRPALVTSTRTNNRIASLNAVTPDHLDAITNMDMHSMNHIMSTTSTWLADAADAVADIAVDAATEEKTGWWQSYLNIFKSTIIFIHSGIDGPLRSVGITQTWGVSIAIFTASMRSLLVPLSIQQSKASEYQKALKPYMKEIKEKFKDNQDMQNRATAKLFEDANQNPLAGCIVSLAQLPIFLGLYRGVRLLAMDGLLNEPFLWIPSLEGPVSAPDYRGLDWLVSNWDTSNGFPPTPSLGWETTLAYLVMPVILVLGQSLTMRVLTPPVDEDMSPEEKETVENSQKFLKFLPLLIGFFSLQVPAGLTIYWLTSNSFTLAQSLTVRAWFKANPPNIELPDYWDALDDVSNMTPEERRKAAEAGIQTGPKFDDLLDEAKYHYVVERTPLRLESAAWERVQTASPGIPEPMVVWVGADVNGASTKEEPAATSSTEEATAPAA
mmetsp:Transcript_15179/g.21482  ORF Transcript_15179/g.21482 Transcript_15179/m.21482 type:complete len:465 (-) Transcript_15179:3031-4425(-)